MMTPYKIPGCEDMQNEKRKTKNEMEKERNGKRAITNLSESVAVEADGVPTRWYPQMFKTVGSFLVINIAK